MPLGRDIVAHSGLLLLTQDSNYYLIERLVGNEEVGMAYYLILMILSYISQGNL